MHFILICLTACIFGVDLALSLQDCRDGFPRMNSMNSDKMAGRWFKIKMAEAVDLESKDCYQVDYELCTKNDFIIKSTFKYLKGDPKEIVEGSSSVTVDKDIPSLWDYYSDGGIKKSVWVAGDVHSWAIQMTCNIFMDRKPEYSIYSRTRVMSPGVATVVESVLESLGGVTADKLEVTNQENCPF